VESLEGNSQQRTLIVESLGVIDEAHMLLENLPRKKDESIPQDIDCFLCRKMGKELKTIYSCIKCRKGFHVSCFAAFHYRGTLSSSHKALLDVVFQSDRNPTVGLPSKYAASDMSQLQLPLLKKKLLVRTHCTLYVLASPMSPADPCPTDRGCRAVGDTKLPEIIHRSCMMALDIL